MDVTQTLFADQETETSLLASVLLVLMVMAVYVLVRLKCDRHVHRHVLWKKRTETLKLLFYTEVQYGCTQSFFLPLIKLHCFHVCLHPLFN